MSDRRAQKSRRHLWQALFALLQDHDWDDINVQMICDRADVARSTFYAHFPTKQDLLETGFSMNLEEIEQLAADLAKTPGTIPTLHWLTSHLRQSQPLRRRLQGSPAGHAIMARFHAMASDLIRRDLTRAGHAPTDAALTFATGGLFAALDQWLTTSCREAEPSLLARLQNQITAVLQA